jgi:hypothetical protein
MCAGGEWRVPSLSLVRAGDGPLPPWGLQRGTHKASPRVKGGRRERGETEERERENGGPRFFYVCFTPPERETTQPHWVFMI